MPVFSYIAYPKAGGKAELIKCLSSLEPCRMVLPAENNDIVLIVTDTPDERAERQLQKQLKKIEPLQSLSMAFGHIDEPE